MQPEALRDPAYLWDLLDAARRLARFTAGISRDEYLANELIQAAVERALEILGEAARRVSDGTGMSDTENRQEWLEGQSAADDWDAHVTQRVLDERFSFARQYRTSETLSREFDRCANSFRE